jgi:hypothetical protein
MLTWKPGVQYLINQCKYAVDVVIIGHTLAVVKETFISMEKASKEMGLTINENKTKFAALKDPAYLTLAHNRSFLIDSHNFELVTEFMHQKSLIN